MNYAYPDISARYRKFAADEARGKSPLYEDLAQRIASDRSILDFLSELPRQKQQPNLLFAAVKFLHGTSRDWDDFRNFVQQHVREIAGLMKTRSTQTNVPERCATLVPLMARLPQPLALLEVGRLGRALPVARLLRVRLRRPYCVANAENRGAAADPSVPSEPRNAASCPGDRG